MFDWKWWSSFMVFTTPFMVKCWPWSAAVYDWRGRVAALQEVPFPGRKTRFSLICSFWSKDRDFFWKSYCPPVSVTKFIKVVKLETRPLEITKPYYSHWRLVGPVDRDLISKLQFASDHDFVVVVVAKFIIPNFYQVYTTNTYIYPGNCFGCILYQVFGYLHSFLVG